MNKEVMKINWFFQIEKIITLKKTLKKRREIKENLSEREEEEIIKKLKMALGRKKK